MNAPHAASQSRPYPASVLIVEDDSDVALSISEVVGSLGYRYHHGARTGAKRCVRWMTIRPTSCWSTC